MKAFKMRCKFKSNALFPYDTFLSLVNCPREPRASISTTHSNVELALESELKYVDKYNFCWHSISILTNLHEAEMQFSLNLARFLQPLRSRSLGLF